MNQTLVSFAHIIGVDKSIAYSSGSRIVQGVTGAGSVFFISTFLSGVEQGFYFTFGSILAMQVFFEMGLTGIMTQFVAHESAYLTLNDYREYEGSGKNKSRLASLVHFCAKWYSVLGILVFVFLLSVGFLFFDRYGYDHAGVQWQIPWILVCIGTAIKLIQSPFVSILSGLGMVKEMSKISFWQQVIIPLATWCGLMAGFKLYVMGVAYILSVVIWQIYVWRTGLAKIIVKLWRTKLTERVLYTKEILPYQWRIALSWISGYFIFQLFNPVLFATEGAVVAGQMGMTLQVLNAIQAFSFSWLNTKVPLFSRYIALHSYHSLDSLFNKTLRQMTSVCLFLLSSFILMVWLLDVSQLKFGNNILYDRFLSYLPLVIMCIPVYLQQYTASWATYLRCHKKEPFLLISICGGILDAISTIVFGKMYGLLGMTIGYCIITLLLFPWGYWIYKTKKREWHDE